MARPTMARPAAFERALATYEIPIERRDEWLASPRGSRDPMAKWS